MAGSASEVAADGELLSTVRPADKSLTAGLAVSLGIFACVSLILGIVSVRGRLLQGSAIAPAHTGENADDAKAGGVASVTNSAQLEEGLAKLTRAWHAERRPDPKLPAGGNGRPRLDDARSSRRSSSGSHLQLLPEVVLVQPRNTESSL